MLKRLILIIGLCSSLGLISTFSYSTVYAATAFDVSGGACGTSTSAGDATACDPGINGKNPIAGNNGIITKAANIISIVAGAGAVLVILAGAIRFITSSGSVQDQSGKPSAVTMGKKMITGGLIGIAIIALARTMIYYLVHHLNT